MRICFFDNHIDLARRFAEEANKRGNLAKWCLLDVDTIESNFRVHLADGGDPMVVIGDFLGEPAGEDVIVGVVRTLSAVDPKTKFVVYSTATRILSLLPGQVLIGLVQKTSVVVDIVEIIRLFHDAFLPPR